MAERAKRVAKKPEPTAASVTAASLAATIKAAPKLLSAKAARARVGVWLGEIAPTQAGRMLGDLLAPDAKSRKLADLVAAIAESSPYLWDLIQA